MRNRSMNLNIYSIYRKELMGIAAIIIILCHIAGNHVLLPTTVIKILGLGNYGVDIFMFMSGLGMFYSLSNYTGSINGWYKKRLIRILIPYLITTFVYCIIRAYYNSFSFTDAILSLSTMDFWLYGRGAWFVAAIIPLYLITPFMSKLIKTRRNKSLWVIIIISILIILSKSNIINNDIYTNIKFVLGRVPMFVLGYYMAHHIKNGITLKIQYVLLISIISIASYIFLNIYTALTIPILFALGYIMKYLHRITFIDKTIIFMGGISLESYLTNIYLATLLGHINFGKIGYGNYLQYILVIIIGIPLAWYINKISKKLLIKKQ